MRIILLLSLLSLPFAISNMDRLGVMSPCIYNCGASFCGRYKYEANTSRCHCFDYSQLVPLIFLIQNISSLPDTCGIDKVVNYTQTLKEAIDIRGDECDDCVDLGYDIAYNYQAYPRIFAKRREMHQLKLSLGIGLPLLLVSCGLVAGYVCY